MGLRVAIENSPSVKVPFQEWKRISRRFREILINSVLLSTATPSAVTPLHNHCTVYFHDPEETKQSNRYLFTSLTRIHDPPPQRTQHAALRYSIHIRNMSVPHCWSPSPSHSIASNSFISFSMRSCLPALYFYQARYPHLHPHAAILILSCIILLLTLHLSCS